MKRFAQLIQQLELSNKTNDKISALVNYFNYADDKDKVWVIALFTGKKPKRPIKSALLKYWAIAITETPEWLFAESYANVGDLSETIALLLPPAENTSNLQLHTWIEELHDLEGKDDETKKEFILNAWNKLETQERFIFNKLISGNFRIGVSNKMLVNALAKQSSLDSAQIMHSIMGKWNPYEITFHELINGIHVNTDNSWPYPFCLAYALEQEPEKLGDISEWQAEWKWDGIRGQIVKRNGELFIWSRGEELVTEQFPELHFMIDVLPDGVVLDGEILAVQDKQVLSFSTLQQRLNRKTINKKQLEEAPIGFFVYDILEYEAKDFRQEPLSIRRKILEQLNGDLDESPVIISPVINCSSWEELADLRQTSRSINSEGIMLKKLTSHYHSGRKRGDWWKWKINPYTVDAVMIYAQKGSGRRANFFTDYTFAVRDGENLVTIAKAYSGLTDKEIKEVNSFVTRNAIEKFGPVRTVKPELVFEIAFEGIAESKRHKAGLALRFPRILRWRKDKKADEINTLEDLRQLLQSTL
ncbi:ATP-dependent DNA ligase [Pedobacter alluvionis]|uniref:DNA ligase (ATP) n=1 Tax=Pedobacter alluvionis TaxID=475253 RepID=A0A497XX66_9SPHI|nr:ATP-dependent DNA ligase [Pedobacter alluvionis]RLJ74790.1 DNA ligase-1 [Pedobacter alluvionis]TFB29922.1 ATP-dependent DNA ligase [Pedobacter alluvionis]